MQRRIAYALLGLYPPAWRDRYTDEVHALLEEQPSVTTKTILDLISGVLDARRHPDATVGGARFMATNNQPSPRYSRRQVLAAGATSAVGIGVIGVAAYLLEQGQNPAPAVSAATSAPVAAGTAGPSSSLVAAVVGSPTPSSEATPAPATTQTATGARSVFRSRPDLSPPVISIVTAAALTVAPGYVFYTPGDGVAPDGPAIVDNTGQLIWSRPDAGKVAAANFGLATYHGKPVLYWWEGANNAGVGMGNLVIADSSYREIVRVQIGDGRTADLHEFQITPQGTALFFAAAPVPANDPATGQPLAYPVMDDEIQEIDIATGKQLFSWHATDHIALGETYIAPPTGQNQVYDYIHANSLDVDTDGNLIMSARNTSAAYKIDRATGKIVWRLGGRKTDFAMGPSTPFSWQHDVRRQADGTITIFDDGNTNSVLPAPAPSGSATAAPTSTPPATAQPSDQPPQHVSRGIVLKLDETAMTATLAGEFLHPQPLLVTSQGNVQVLPNGNVFIGWGSTAWFTEFDPLGNVLFDATFPASKMSYRDYRFQWTGMPTDNPAVAVVPGNGGGATVYVSWNGATEVAGWDVLTGDAPSSMSPVASAPRTGFETAVFLPATKAYVSVHARDTSGKLLGTSTPTKV